MVGTEKGALLRFHPSTGRQKSGLHPTHAQRVNDLVFSRNGQRLYSVAHDLMVWNMPSGKLRGRHLSGETRLLSVGPRESGRWVGVVSADGKVRVYPTHAIPKKR